MRIAQAEGDRRPLSRRDARRRRARRRWSSRLVLGALPLMALTVFASYAGSASAGLSLPQLPSITIGTHGLQLVPKAAPSTASTNPLPQNPVLRAVGTVAASVASAASSTLQVAALPSHGPAENAPAAALPTVSPGLLAPTSVVASQPGQLPDVTVSWTYAATGLAANGAIVQLDKVVGPASVLVSQIRCGSCTSSTFRALSFGTEYVAHVSPLNDFGEGPSAASAPVTPTTTCVASACVDFDTTTSIGAANHAASGLVDSLFPSGNDQSDATSLVTSLYRSAPGATPSGGALNWSNFTIASKAGAQTVVMLDGLWKEEHAAPTPTPWSNWTAYAQWVTATVAQIEASGHSVDYWDVYNEPGGDDGYYNQAGYDSETPALLLQQFLVAYRAIEAADPSAQVIGPELEYWSDYPGQFGPTAKAFDMATFLTFAADNGIRLAAVSWHEILDGFGPNAEENTLYPAIIEDHVAQARALIASHPSLGNPKIFITEYGMPEVQKIPGWDVEYLAALTDAGVNMASRSCWSGDCYEPTLDGLLWMNGKSPLPAYYDRLVYASMSGQMVSTSTNSDTIGALGSYNAATQTFTGLVGRGMGCSQILSCNSSFPDSQRGPSVPVNVTVTVPWTSGTVHVSVTHISGLVASLPASAPGVSSTSLTVVPNGHGQGTVLYSIGNFADGDAYGFTITR